MSADSPYTRAIAAWRPDAQILELADINAGATNKAAKAKLATGEVLFLKHILGTPREQWLSQRQMIQELQSLGFPSIYPLFVRDEPGELVEIYGYHPDNTLQFSKETICQKAGGLMAQLHRTKDGYRRPWPLSFTEARKVRETIPAEGPAEEAAFWEKFSSLHEKLFNPAPEFCHCHGDLFYDNLLMESETQAFLIDFEDSFYGPWMGDVGVAVMALGFRNGAWQADRVKAFLEGYRLAAGEPELEFPNLGLWAEYGACARTWWRLRHVLLKNERIVGLRDWKEYLAIGNVEAVLGPR